MTLPYFCYNGVSSLEKRAVIAKGGKNSYDGVARDIELVEIPGRDGALIIDSGRRPNQKVEYSLILLANTYDDEMAFIAQGLREWLLSDVGYHELWDTYDPRYFRYAAYSGGVKIDQDIPSLGTTKVTFTCKPYRYSFAGKEMITLTSAQTITNPERLASAPCIKVYGSGEVILTVNSQTYRILSVEDSIEIDSEMMNVYSGETALNHQWESDGFPSLLPGENSISWEGDVSKIELIPRWRSL